MQTTKATTAALKESKGNHLVAKKNVHPDNRYIDALLSNDVALLNELYQRFAGKIKSMVLQNNGTETDAADIFQDALLSIFKKAKSQNFVLTCPMEAFLYLVCKNKWMNELSKRKSYNLKFIDVEKYEEVEEDIFRFTEECFLQQERNALFIEKFSELSESAQQLLHLSWSGKSMEEVAQALNVTYGYARKKKSECMAKLIALVRQSSKFDSLK